MADSTKAEKLAAARKKAEKLKAKKAAEATKEKKTEPETAEKEADEVTLAEKTADSPAPGTPTTAAQPSPTTDTSSAALEAKLQELERECAEAKSARDEAQLMADALEKKVASLEMLHTEDEAQVQRLEAQKAELEARLEKVESDVLRLSKKEAQDGGGTDNDHLDELEDEERLRLERKIRELEAENTDLRRGIWHDRRKDMQVGMEDGSSPGGFTTVDLGGNGGATSPAAHRKQSGLGGYFTSGLNALTGANSHDDEFLEEDDDFDEEAFRIAAEEAAKARIERIKEVKRGLNNWQGWRLDLVEGRRGGGEGVGDMFEI